MCSPAVIPYVIAAVAAVSEGYSQQQEGKFKNNVAKYNARNLENEATQTRNKGTEEENAHREKVQQLISQQTATIGASGIDINSGSPLQMQTDAATMGEVDALRIRSNYGDAANALSDKANLVLSEGAYAQSAGNRAFGNSILAGAGKLYDSWYTPTSAAKIGNSTTTMTGEQATQKYGGYA